MHNVQRTILAQQLLGLRTSRTMRQIDFGYAGQPLEIVMACIAKVCCAETEKHGNGATVPTLVLQEIRSMLGTHLGTGHIRASSAHQFLGVEFVAHFSVATRFSAVVSFVAFEADIVGVTVHGVSGQILCVGCFVLAFVFKSVQCKCSSVNESVERER